MNIYIYICTDYRFENESVLSVNVLRKRELPEYHKPQHTHVKRGR